MPTFPGSEDSLFQEKMKGKKWFIHRSNTIIVIPWLLGRTTVFPLFKRSIWQETQLQNLNGCFIDTSILHNADPHISIFQETICSRLVLKWQPVIIVGSLLATLLAIFIYQTVLQIIIIVISMARRRSKKVQFFN